MTKNIDFEVVSWEKTYSMLMKLAHKINADGFQPDLIVGVCRGGWLPARVLSDLLGIPRLASVTVESYSGVAERWKRRPSITQPLFVHVEGKSMLVVDDVADTGKSLRLVKSHLTKSGAKEIKLATLYHKPWSITRPDYFEKKTRRWIIFPWERKETVWTVIEKYHREGKTLREVREKLTQSGLKCRLFDYFAREYGEGEG